MSRPPSVLAAVASMPSRVYSGLAARLQHYDGETYPLHVGDTWMEPPQGCRMQDLTVAEYPGMHRYPPPSGRPDLLQAIAEWTERRGYGAVDSSEILLAASATHALSVAVTALVAPGDEVLILAPFWPLFAGMVRLAGGVPVPVPILDVQTPEQLAAALDAATTERTVALYANSPHNPTGRILPRSWFEVMAARCRQHNHWLFTDDVYAYYAYAHPFECHRDLARERTLSTWSFSKAYGMAGNRCGYLLAPPEIVAELQKVAIHTAYSAPAAAQIAAMRALRGPGDAWAADAARSYEQTGRKAAERLGVPAPEGGTFLFLDVSDAFGDDGLAGLLGRCVDRGLLVAPGHSFGPFPNHIRVCFTSAPPDQVLRGIEVLAQVLGR